MRSWPKLIATERSLINEVIFSAFKFLEKKFVWSEKIEAESDLKKGEECDKPPSLRLTLPPLFCSSQNFILRN